MRGLHNNFKELSDLVSNSGVTFDQLNSAINKSLENYVTWSDTRGNTISTLNGIATDLDECHRNVDIANATGASVGAVGGALAIGGTIASFFTLGLAAPIAIVGTAMAVAGGVTSIGASLAEYGITKDRCKRAQLVYNTDMEAISLLGTDLTDIKKLNETLTTQMTKMQKWKPEDVSEAVDHTMHDLKGLGASAMGSAAIAAWKNGAFEGVKELQSVGGKLENLSEVGDFARLGNIARSVNFDDLGSIGSTLLKSGAKFGGAVLDAVGVAFDIWTIVEASKDLKSGAESPSAEKLRAQVTTLQDQRNKIDNIHSSLVKAAAQTKMKGGKTQQQTTGGEASGNKQETPVQSSQQRARKQKEREKEGGSRTKTEPEKPEQTNPKRGHHVFNNVPKLIRDLIDEYFKNNLHIRSRAHQMMGFECFDTFYLSLDSLSQQCLKPIWTDYEYWKTDPTVTTLRDTIKVFENRKQTENKDGELVDENTGRWNEAQVSVKTAVDVALRAASGVLSREERLQHHFTGVQVTGAADKLLEAYTDSGAEEVYIEKYGKTEEYCQVKEMLRRKVRELPSRVQQWETAVQGYFL